MPERTVNLKILSEHLGLSQTTVSRALNGFPEVAEKTRKRVADAARALNYRPSPTAASLATGKSWSIGHVVPLSAHRMIDPHFSDFLAGASEVYSRRGYDMVIKAIGVDEEEQVYRDLVARRRVDGVVVHGPVKNDPRINLLQQLQIPFVVHGRSDGVAGDYCWLDVNNKSAFTRATQVLVDLGHERIALLNGPQKMNFSRRRHKGFVETMAAAGLKVLPELLASADMVEPYGYEKAREMLQSANPPTAFLSSSILVTLGIARALHQAGLKIGKDVSVISYDDCLSFLQTEKPASTPPYFTSMQSSIQEAGRRIAEILIDRISAGDKPPVQELWEAQLVNGVSTGPNPFKGRP